ncbi:putative beta-lactamase domain-containing protein 2 [Apostichopus japonicus]|uniref:Putative beta-lactamase domain-containing protein 2 n=1 Tax=Stichopus japonicus TaxID=307972 RepID=A0A2G8K9E6_STIJA|nr:putative beta-lactamase domain-containing protein 2 [Apostichopus japonicus]
MSLLKSRFFVIATIGIIVAFVVQKSHRSGHPIPEVFGNVSPGFEDVLKVFRENYEHGWDKAEAGSAFSVYHKGEKVVDIWAGYADYEAEVLWKEDTMSILLSTTKGLSALCILVLADRGLIDFKETVAYYWPEFAQKGKEKITVEMLLEHEAGLAVISEELTFDLLRDRHAMDRVLAATEPLWEPGTTHGYHVISFGFYVDALVRRVDPRGRTVGQFFAQEIAEPFGIDAYIGTPLDVSHRVARLVLVRGSLADITYYLWTSHLFRALIYGFALGRCKTFTDVIKNCGEVCKMHQQEDPELRKLEFPSGNGIGSARAIAKLYGILANGGKLGNKTLLSPEFIDELAHDKRGQTGDFVFFNLPFRWKYGIEVIPQPNEDNNIFGASGVGGQIGYADKGRQIGYGFVTRFLSPVGLQLYDPRIQRLKESVLQALRTSRGKQ